MPLSEEELRLLEQMERALAAEDPKFVSALQGRTLRRVARMRSLAAGAVFLGGIALMMTGAMTAQIWLGILGFVVMLASAMVGLAAWRGHRVPEERPSSPDALFDFDDHPHRFEVLDGGRANRPKRQVRHPKQRRERDRKQGTFMQRMEQRWQHRRDQGF
ncbi:MAG TPA: DUF3040 domain-containing protein [Marmoricola sp.]|nr:DUF3040 domain-containing protein [Marmoricola sp.]